MFLLKVVLEVVVYLKGQCTLINVQFWTDVRSFLNMQKKNEETIIQNRTVTTLSGLRLIACSHVNRLCFRCLIWVGAGREWGRSWRRRRRRISRWRRVWGPRCTRWPSSNSTCRYSTPCWTQFATVESALVIRSNKVKQITLVTITIITTSACSWGKGLVSVN